MGCAKFGCSLLLVWAIAGGVGWLIPPAGVIVGLVGTAAVAWTYFSGWGRHD